MTTHITKTWFDGQKVVTQEIPESEVYKPVHMTDRELMQQALEALEYAADDTKPEGLYGCECLVCKAIPALRNRLAQPDQEEELEVLPDLGPVWSGFTDEELEAMAEQYVTDCYFDTLKYGQAIQSKLKEKNV